jgi:penicillin-binding protein 2
LGETTGIDLPGEAAGQVDSAALRATQHKENPTAFPYPSYQLGDNIETAFGQGETLVTPIQQAVAYATFANGGTRYQPEVAAAIVSPTGKLVKQIQPKVTGTVSLPPSTYQPMLQGFEGVVSDKSGTAYLPFQEDAHFPMNNYPIAGKTGTADVAAGKEPNAWFVGFGPTNHAGSNPEYVVAVVVDHGGYGAQAAAPAAANIFNYLYANPIQPVQLPTATSQPSTTPPATIPPAGTPASTTSTTTSSTSSKSTTPGT